MSQAIVTEYILNSDNKVDSVTFSTTEGKCKASLNEDGVTYNYTSRLEDDDTDVPAENPMSLADCVLSAHIHLGLIPPQNFEPIHCENAH